MSIEDYHTALGDGDREICDRLRGILYAAFPDGEAKVWHGHPVWFLARNPIAGYSRVKAGVRLMFWSGQGFDTPGLVPTGTFKAAAATFTAVDTIDVARLEGWCAEAREVQLDYANIVKRKGRLLRL